MKKITNKSRIASAKRIVVKIGSVLLVDDNSGTLHDAWLSSLAKDLATLRHRGHEVILVSSGAIALGRRYLKFKPGELKLEEKQASAAVGMVRLAQSYQDTLNQFDLSVAQILLTLDDSENRRRYLNARSTIMTLLRVGAVPLINENDTIATDEIRFGDNDRLAARVAAMVSADLLILLSNISGLYTADPTQDKVQSWCPLSTKLHRKLKRWPVILLSLTPLAECQPNWPPQNNVWGLGAAWSSVKDVEYLP